MPSKALIGTQQFPLICGNCSFIARLSLPLNLVDVASTSVSRWRIAELVYHDIYHVHC